MVARPFSTAWGLIGAIGGATLLFGFTTGFLDRAKEESCERTRLPFDDTPCYVAPTSQSSPDFIVFALIFLAAYFGIWAVIYFVETQALEAMDKRTKPPPNA